MRIAVITGASSGMGREFVKQIERYESYDEIWVIARSEDKLRALQSEVKTPLRVISLDLTKQESYDAYQALLEKEQPDIHTLINCSGYGKFGKYDEISLSDSLGMIDLNCKALVAMTVLSLPYIKRGGRIVQIDSLSAFQPVPYLNIYGSTKAFVLSYSRALNVELQPRGIRVMSVNPGWVKTNFFDRAEQKDDPVVTYMNVLYEPQDVVRTALHDLYKTNKDVSIHGFPVKAQVFGVKLLPHRLIMKIWMKQQKLPKKQGKHE
ncbi:MAG: SDR family NAD(P)-dependent oxidoreductase [Clostridia bacterium]|nr:SDR family NAD(P)-dependent oxidoreductase [Clostridia bacterium]